MREMNPRMGSLGSVLVLMIAACGSSSSPTGGATCSTVADCVDGGGGDAHGQEGGASPADASGDACPPSPTSYSDPAIQSPCSDDGLYCPFASPWAGDCTCQAPLGGDGEAGLLWNCTYRP